MARGYAAGPPLGDGSCPGVTPFVLARIRSGNSCRSRSAFLFCEACQSLGGSATRRGEDLAFACPLQRLRHAHRPHRRSYPPMGMPSRPPGFASKPRGRSRRSPSLFVLAAGGPTPCHPSPRVRADGCEVVALGLSDPRSNADFPSACHRDQCIHPSNISEEGRMERRARIQAGAGGSRGNPHQRAGPLMRTASMSEPLREDSLRGDSSTIDTFARDVGLAEWNDGAGWRRAGTPTARTRLAGEDGRGDRRQDPPPLCSVARPTSRALLERGTGFFYNDLPGRIGLCLHFSKSSR